MTAYTTFAEAVHYEIVEPLGEFADCHDLDTIADAVIFVGEGGKYYADPDVDFWHLVEANALD